MNKTLRTLIAILAAMALMLTAAARPLAAQPVAAPDQDKGAQTSGQAAKTETAQESEQVKQLKARVAVGMASPAELEALQKMEA